MKKLEIVFIPTFHNTRVAYDLHSVTDSNMTDILMSNLNLFNSAMGKAEFKEKLGRLLQYGARMVSGILTDSDKLSPSKDRQELIAKVR